jgi:crossover junction endodeoxyribonuclease RuvC
VTSVNGDRLRILGVDPGLQVTGYGVVELAGGAIEPTLIEAGVVRLNRSATIEHRLAQLHRELAELIDAAGPGEVAVEKLYAHYAHPRTAILMGHARGVILLAARQAGLAVQPLPSTEVKKAITGYGHASKEQIQLAIQSQCGLAEMPSPPDVADAIAIALCHARRVAIDRAAAR